MKKILGLFMCLFLLGCNSIDEDLLKSEIKSELQEDFIFDINDLNKHMIDITNQITIYTVAIIVTINEESSVLGSGFIYNKEGNTYSILTNEHVIRYASSIEVYLPIQDKYIAATVNKTSQEDDLAILDIISPDELDVYNIINVDYSIGELVLAVGASTSIDYINTVTLGIISNVSDNLIQHDAAINNGSSGGPLFNINGDLIGLNCSKINTNYYGGATVFVEGMGFAIDINTIISFINE